MDLITLTARVSLTGPQWMECYTEAGAPEDARGLAGRGGDNLDQPQLERESA
jgi:hypothetical protein